MKKILISVMLALNVAGALAADKAPVARKDIKREAWTVGGFYEGNIGSAPFQMNIEYPNGHREGMWFRSQYWYPKQVTNLRMPVKLANNGSDGSFKIVATVQCDDDVAAHCRKEYFIGKWNSQMTEAKGTWSSELNGKTLPFQMSLRAKYQGENLSYLVPPPNESFEGKPLQSNASTLNLGS